MIFGSSLAARRAHPPETLPVHPATGLEQHGRATGANRLVHGQCTRFGSSAALAATTSSTGALAALSGPARSWGRGCRRRRFRLTGRLHAITGDEVRDCGGLKHRRALELQAHLRR